jgi:putative restriction endonuclease
MIERRLKSIVPMFGGGTQYVATLDAILTFVAEYHPTTNEVIGWHRGNFPQVESRDSIQRRVDYLEAVGFLESEEDYWTLGPEGKTYLADQSLDVLIHIMCRRNVGLRSLLYALAAGSMTIEEVSQQQLDAHRELGWSQSNTDMAKQRVNWLRSLKLVEKYNGTYQLTDRGYEFVDTAIERWTDTDPTTECLSADSMTAGVYETTVQARAVDPEFRATVLNRYGTVCPVSGVDHPVLLDVAHVLPWSEFPDYRADPSNVFPLSKTHHAAFDRGLFTIDQEFYLRVNPEFETESKILQQTIVEQAGKSFSVLAQQVTPEYLEQRNESLDWIS